MTASTLGNLILLISAVALFWYTLETRWLRQGQELHQTLAQAPFLHIGMDELGNYFVRNLSHVPAYHLTIIWYDGVGRQFAQYPTVRGVIAPAGFADYIAAPDGRQRRLDRAEYDPRLLDVKERQVLIANMCALYRISESAANQALEYSSTSYLLVVFESGDGRPFAMRQRFDGADEQELWATNVERIPLFRLPDTHENANRS
jgi:hypothetical protein